MPLEEVLSELNLTEIDFFELIQQGTQAIIHNPIVADTLLVDAVQRYVNDLKVQVVTNEKSKLTLKTYHDELKRFLEFMEGQWCDREPVLTNVTETDIRLLLGQIKPRSKKDKCHKPSTFNKILAILSAFFKFFINKELLLKSPTADIKFLDEGELNFQSLDKAEEKKVLLQAKSNKENGERDFMIIYLTINTGLRLSEIAFLKVSDINFKTDTMEIFGKGRKWRVATLTDEVREELMQYLKKERRPINTLNCDEPLFLTKKGPNAYRRGLSERAIVQMITRVFRECGIEDGATHRLRHTFAINALDSGLNVVQIQYLLGHKNITTTMKYLRLLEKDIQEKIKKDFPLAFLSIKNILESYDRQD